VVNKSVLERLVFRKYGEGSDRFNKNMSRGAIDSLENIKGH
jgi:hypothetical protein